VGELWVEDEYATTYSYWLHVGGGGEREGKKKKIIKNHHNSRQQDHRRKKWGNLYMLIMKLKTELTGVWCKKNHKRGDRKKKRENIVRKIVTKSRANRLYLNFG